MQSANARLGLKLFIVYLVLYAGFVLINAFAPEMMERTPFAGINLAVLYGFGLITGALVLSLAYGMMCQDEEEDGVDAAGASSEEAA